MQSWWGGRSVAWCVVGVCLWLPLAVGCADRFLEANPADSPPDPCLAGMQRDPATGRCEEKACSSDAVCGEGLRCDLLEGACYLQGPDEVDDTSPTCTAGARRCGEDGSRQRCDGTRWIDYPCPGYAGCDGGSCTPCLPGDRRCHPTIAGARLICDLDGIWYAQACPQAGATCVDGSCSVCQPGESTCTVDAVMTCTTDGLGWKRTPCDEGQVCRSLAEGARCETPVCVAHDSRCHPSDPGAREVCVADGSRWTRVDCAGDTQCREPGARCLDPCAVAAEAGWSTGCAYVFAQQPAIGVVYQASGQVRLLVSNHGEGPATVRLDDTLEGEPLVEDLSIEAGATVEIPLPRRGQASSLLVQAGFHLTSTVPVEVHLENLLAGEDHELCTCDGSPCSPDDPCRRAGHRGGRTRLQPLHQLAAPGQGSRYVAWVPRHQRGAYDRPGLLTVVAAQDGTEVEVVPTAPIQASHDGAVPALAAGVRHGWTLAAGQVLQLASAPAGDLQEVEVAGQTFLQWSSGLSGTTVEATGPVAVFAGSGAYSAPLATQPDLLVEQVPGLHHWGTDHVAAVRNPFDRFEVVAGDRKVTVSFDPVVRDEQSRTLRVKTLPPRGVLSVVAPQDFRLQADGEVLLVRLSRSDSTAGAAAVVVPPLAAATTDYALALPWGRVSEVEIVSPARTRDGSAPSVWLGDSLVEAWRPLGLDHRIARVRLCGGGSDPCPGDALSVRATAPVVVTVVERAGWGSAHTPAPISPSPR